MREIESLDGMRGIAALLVVGFHVSVFASALDPAGEHPEVLDQPLVRGWLTWGFIGVDFFFVLSAFLLSQPFLARKQDAAGLRAYAGKRLLRVLPPYYASILVVWLLVGRTGHPWFAIDWHQLWTHLLFVHTFYPDAALSVSAVYWTLAIELQFYLLLPLVALAFRGRHWPWALAACLAITLAYRAWVPHEDVGITRWHEQQIPGYLWHFGLGITAARLRAPVRAWLRDARVADLGILLAALALIVLPSAVVLNQPVLDAFQHRSTIMAYRPTVALGFAAIILLACSAEGRAARALATPLFQAFGRWSYSIYLVHYPVGAFLLLNVPGMFVIGIGAMAITLCVASLLTGAAFYAMVEAPSLRLKDRLLGARSRRGQPEPAPTT
jgi:peptidoglycan/LPS O-acetylase OafA/YrhL